ncbi:MAG TPA: hypothetical protein PLZ57_13320 [Pseudobdellovibrionaceae bacterium]|nr:hypothetical protein [Pseudobdellovibrionaceae bacterium]
MKVQVLTFRCLVRDRLGRVLSSSLNQDVMSCPEQPRGPLAALDRNLQDVKPGECRRIPLKAEEAFGLYDAKKVFPVDRGEFHHIPRVGEYVEWRGVRPRVDHLTADEVWLDANHPFAGQDLVFEIEVTSAREATRDEIADAISDSDESAGAGPGPDRSGGRGPTSLH